MEKKRVSLADVKRLFYPAATAAEFNAEWQRLSDVDKREMLAMIEAEQGKAA